MKKKLKCYTEITYLNNEGAIDMKKKNIIILENHIFKKENRTGNQVCVNCGLILSK